MSDDPEDSDELLELLSEDGGTQSDPILHPTSGTLSAYAAGTLSPDQELEIQEHLVSCRRCRDLILDFATFMETPLDEEREETPGSSTPVKPQELSPPVTVMSRRIRREPLWRTLLPIAASLVVVVLAGTLIGISRSNGELRASNKKLQTRVAELQSPRLGGAVRLEATRGSASASSISSNKMTDIEVTTSNPEKFPSYEIELAEEDGKVFWSDSTENGEGSFHLFLMPGFPKPGLYRVRLFGVQGAKREPLESYSVRINP